jgi:hypothetical protein
MNDAVASTVSRKWSKAEWALRVQLAEFHRLVEYLGWSEMIFNHISVRLPGPERYYLVNPFGLFYDEVTPDNLLKVTPMGSSWSPHLTRRIPRLFPCTAPSMERGRIFIASSTLIQPRFRRSR